MSMENQSLYDLATEAIAGCIPIQEENQRYLQNASYIISIYTKNIAKMIF